MHCGQYVRRTCKLSHLEGSGQSRVSHSIVLPWTGTHPSIICNNFWNAVNHEHWVRSNAICDTVHLRSLSNIEQTYERNRGRSVSVATFLYYIGWWLLIGIDLRNITSIELICGLRNPCGSNSCSIFDVHCSALSSLCITFSEFSVTCIYRYPKQNTVN